MQNKQMRGALMIIMIPLMLVLFISSLDQTIVATALPNIAKAIGGTSQVTWVTTAYLITSAITTLIFGKLGDQFGRKRTLMIALIMFLVGSLLAGMAGNMTMLIIFRAFQGLGGGGLNALVMAVIGDLVPPLERSRYQGLTGLVPAIALIAGPFLGGFIADHFSWRWIFYINLPIGVVALILIATRMNLPIRKESEKIDWLGGILAAVTTTSLLLALSWGGTKYAWNSVAVIGLFGLSALSLLAYILVEHYAAEPITPLNFFRSSIFDISLIQFLLSTLALFVGMVFVPMFLQTVDGYSGTKAGIFVIPMMIGLMTTSAISGEMITRTGRYKFWPVIGAAMVGVAMWLLSNIQPNTSMWLVGGAMLLSGLGQGAMIQVALVAGQNAVPYQQLGAATGALNFFKSLGGAFGSAIFAAILTHESQGVVTVKGLATSFGNMFMWVVPIMAVSVVLGLLMPEKKLSSEIEALNE